MGIITKLALRNMKRRKTRYILTTVTLVIGVSLFGGVLIANDSFQVTFINDLDRRMGTADILLRNTEHEDGWFDADDLEEIEKIDHVTDISYRISGFNVFLTAERGGSRDENSTFSAVYGIDPNSKDEAELGGPQDIKDSEVKGKTMEDLLEDADDDEIVITDSLQIKLGNDFEAGDSVYIQSVDLYKKLDENEDVVNSDSSLWPKYKVIAIVQDWGEARDFDPETPEEFTQPSRGPCLFINIDGAHDLVDGTNDYRDKFNLVAIGVDDLNLIEDVIDDIEDELDDDYWVAADLKTDSIESINNSMTMMRMMFLMFALIALILSVILILNIFNIIKEEQEYETGMLQAIGSSKSETFKMFLTQGLVMGIIGAILGTVGSYFMSYFIFWITMESLRNLPGQVGEYFEGFEFEIVLYPETLGITFAVGVISCILASIYPSWKASRKPIIECLNPLAKKTERMKKHFRRRILYAVLASSLIFAGAYLLFTVEGRGPDADEDASIISMVAPTIMLLGIIGLLDLFVGPITNGFVKLFGPYLKQTKLLTRKNVLRHKKRTILTFSMISLTTSYLIGLSVFMGSMRAGVQTTVNDVMGGDIRIIVADTPLDFKENLKDRSGVEEVMGVTYKNVQIWDDGDREWIGHSSLEEEWDISVTANVVEKGVMIKRMGGTTVLDPEDATFTEVMRDLNKEYKVMITDEGAEKFDLKEGDSMIARFSLGLDYPSLDDALFRIEDGATEISITAELEVVAVVDEVQGFGFSALIGEDVESYSIFISWNTWEALALNDLPGGGTDIMVRQGIQSGDLGLDLVRPYWFNFSDIIGEIEKMSEIKYYTTRMDYNSPTHNLNHTSIFAPLFINQFSSVVGIRTNSSEKLKDDSYFGEHQLIEKLYDNSTMEQLLNTSAKVCVVDESFVNFMKLNDTDFGIGSNISIFPQRFNSVYTDLPGDGTTLYIIKNGTIESGSPANLTSSDDVSFTLVSDETSLEFNLIIKAGGLAEFYLKPFNITFESSINATVDSLELQVYNNFIGDFQKLADINNTVKTNYTITFNQDYLPYTFISPTGDILLRIIGQNSTYDGNYNISIDKVNFKLEQSVTKIADPTSWDGKYEVVGIVKDPRLATTERAMWASSVEKYYDVSNSKNTVYINYEKARNIIYPHNEGNLNNGTADKITSLLIKVRNIEQIENVYNQLKKNLNNLNLTEGGVWTVLDLKTPTLDSRTYANDWYIWIEEGVIDEELKDDLIEYIEDKGYIVLFGFTRTFVENMFRGMIDLITTITTGVLVFAIIISMIGLALHSLLSTMARRREIGMLRSIGLSKKGVVRTVSGETIIISLLGAFIGIFAGLLQGYLMVSAVPAASLLKVTFTIPWEVIGGLVGVTIITAIVSSRYPSKWAANLNIIDAVRTR